MKNARIFPLDSILYRFVIPRDGCLPQVVKPILNNKGSCRNCVAVMFFTLDTVFLHERQRELQAGEGGGRWARAFGRAGRDPPGVEWSPGHNKLAEREVKNTAGWVAFRWDGP